MALALDGGAGTITGLSVGGLPDGVVDADTLASGTGGKVVQIVRTDYKTAASTTTAFTARLTTVPTTSNAGAEFFSATITPASTDNELLFHVNITGMGNGDGKQLYCALFKDSDSNSISSSAAWIDSTDPQNMHLTHSMTVPSTSSQEYKVYCGCGNGNFYINQRHTEAFHGGVASSGITIIEYTPPS
jgi:hypothetical protein